MLDTRTVDNLRFLLEEAVRDYSRAKNQNENLKLLIGRAMLEGVEYTDDLLEQHRTTFSDNENTMTVAKDQFEFTKRKFVEMIERLELPE